MADGFGRGGRGVCQGVGLLVVLSVGRRVSGCGVLEGATKISCL